MLGLVWLLRTGCCSQLANVFEQVGLTLPPPPKESTTAATAGTRPALFGLPMLMPLPPEPIAKRAKASTSREVVKVDQLAVLACMYL